MNENNNIADLVKSGKYFEQSKSWYASKHVNPFVERTLGIIFAAALSVILLISLWFYNQIIFVEKRIDIVSKVDDTTRYYSTIKSLTDDKSDPDKAIIMYMIKEYVQIRESYSYNNVQDDINFIKNQSSPDIAKAYVEQSGLNSPISPMIIYGKFNIREIAISNVELNKNLTQAIVHFQATVKSLKTDETQVSKFVAKLSFDLEKVDKLLEKHVTVLPFKVNDYTIQMIK